MILAVGVMAGPGSTWEASCTQAGGERGEHLGSCMEASFPQPYCLLGLLYVPPIGSAGSHSHLLQPHLHASQKKHFQVQTRHCYSVETYDGFPESSDAG